MRHRHLHLAALLVAAALPACGKRSDPPGTVIKAEQVRTHGPMNQDVAPGPHLQPVGLWSMAEAVNQLSGETDHNAAPKLSIAAGSNPGAFQIRRIPGTTAVGAGQLGPKPKTLVFVDPTWNERFTCALYGPDDDDMLLCDNGEPVGIGSRINPMHRSFIATRLCGAPGALRRCNAGSRDRAPPL